MVAFKGSKRRLLLVEDNPGDVDLILDALRDEPCEVTVARDGVEAMAMLAASRPNLVVLDLNLPRKDGREVLREMKADALLRHIPVVVLSSSEAERDLVQAYSLHANCFLTKPVDLEEFLAVIASMAEFWLHRAQLVAS